MKSHIKSNRAELKIVVSNTPEAPAVEPAPEQVEMPFAIVNGEPVTQMPKDLYIPPQAMEVFLEAFEGPLDLLLYLIRRQNLNILDIPLAEITRQYMQYIEVMSELQLELAGEYMVMAATLAEIKSRMLLPRPKVDAEGNEEDPRAELVRRLQEYERFKRAAESIDALPRLERDVWTTSAELKDRKVVRLLPTVTLQEMLIAFKDVVVRSEMFAHHHIQRERLSVRERMGDILTTLEHASFVEFVRLFRLEEGRMGVTVTFMALLELVREGLIEIVQAEPFAPIHVRAAGASRKLHVVGGNDALGAGAEGVLAADGPPADAAAAAAGGISARDAALAAGGASAGEAALGAVGPAGGAAAVGASARETAPRTTVGEAASGSAVVVGGAVAGDTLNEGFAAPPIDDDLARFAEPALDPNFVDDSDDELDEGPLEGVDDVVDLVAPAVPVPSDAHPAAGGAGASVGEAADVGDAANVAEAANVGEAANVSEAAGVVAVDSAAALVEAFAVVEPLLVPDEAPHAFGSMAALDEPTAIVELIPVGLAEPVSEATLVVVDTAPLSEVVQGDAAASASDPVVAVGASVAVDDLASLNAIPPVDALEIIPAALVEPGSSDSVVTIDAPELPGAAFEPALTDVAAGPVVVAHVEVAPLLDVSPPLEVSLPSDVPTSAFEPSSAGEPPVSVDPTSFADPAAPLELEPSGEAHPLDESPPLDVEYAVPAEELASGEQATSDDEVSLVGDAPVAGEVSLIGDESVSGGPAVEVEEIAFNELPALDETRPADQQTAAAAQKVVNENAGTDEPPSPREESDD